MDVKDREILERIDKKLERFVSRRHSFYRGVYSALGATIGLTIVLTIFGWVLTQISFVPIIGNFAHDVLDFVNATSNLPN